MSAVATRYGSALRPQTEAALISGKHKAIAAAAAAATAAAATTRAT